MATTGADKYFSEEKDYFGYGAASFEYRKLASHGETLMIRVSTSRPAQVTVEQ